MKKVLNKYHNLPVTVKATIWFTLCNLVIKGINFITVPIFTRIMSDYEYGKLSIFLSYEQLVLVLATWEIQNGAYQKGLFKYRNEEKNFSIATQALANILTVIFFGMIFLLRDHVIELTGMSTNLLLLLLIYMMVQPSYTCWLIRNRTMYRYKEVVITTIIYTSLNLLLPLIAVLTIDNTASIKYTFTLASSIFFCVFFYVKNAKYSIIIRKWNNIKNQWKFLIKFEAPLVLHSLSYLVLGQADKIMIGKMVGPTQVAYYGVAYSIASIVIILQNSINQSILPWRYKMLEGKHYKKISDVTTFLVAGFGLFVLLIILVFPEIIKLLFTDNYYEAIWSMPPITVGVFFMFLYTIFVNVESFYEKTQYVMYVSVSCGIINVVLNYVCIKLFGYIACGYTTMISYILFACGHFGFMKLILRKEIPGANVVNGKSLLIISSLVVLISIVFTIMYPYPIVRYSILLLLLGILLFFKSNILDGIKKMKSMKEDV